MASILRRLRHAWLVFLGYPQLPSPTLEERIQWYRDNMPDLSPGPLTGGPMPASPADLTPLPNNGPPLFEGMGVRAFLNWVGHAPDLASTGLLVLRTVEVDPPQRILGEVLVAREAWPEYRALIDDSYARLNALVMAREAARAAGMDDL